MKQHFVLDTNIFFSFQKGISIGDNPPAVIQSLISAATRTTGALTFFIPPRMVDEILTILDPEHHSKLHILLQQVTVESPDLSASSLSPFLFAKLIEEGRLRNLQGMQAAEEVMRQIAAEVPGATMQHVERQKALQPYVRNFRERYRTATRIGYIDSLADLDLIMLAKSKDAAVVTADEGLLTWARVFGARECDLKVFGEMVRATSG